MNYQRVQEFISVSLEVLPRKLKKFENSQTSGGTFLNLSDNLQSGNLRVFISKF